MTKKPFKDYVTTQDACKSAEACADEVLREVDTRRRLYDRWVAEGRMTWQEGHDRMTRLMGALKLLLETALEANPELPDQDKPY